MLADLLAQAGGLDRAEAQAFCQHMAKFCCPAIMATFIYRFFHGDLTPLAFMANMTFVGAIWASCARRDRPMYVFLGLFAVFGGCHIGQRMGMVAKDFGTRF